MRRIMGFLLCVLFCWASVSPAFAGDRKETKAKKKRLTQAEDNIFKYSNKQLTGLLKDKTPKEVVSKFGLPDRIAAKVNKGDTYLFYKYGKTYTDKDKGVVFLNGRVLEVTVCQ